MTLANRLSKAGLRTLAIGLLAMAVAIGANMPLGRTTAHATTTSPGQFRPGAVDCIYYSTGTGGAERLELEGPLAASYGDTHRVEYWIRALDARNPQVVLTSWSYGSAWLVPADGYFHMLGGIRWQTVPSAPFVVEIYARMSDISGATTLGVVRFVVQSYREIDPYGDVTVMPNC